MNESIEKLCRRLRLEVPILLAPMAGILAPSLSIAVAQAGGLGSCGVLLMTPEEIARWSAQLRAAGTDAFALNNWIPDPPPHRDRQNEARVAAFLGHWGPAVTPEAAEGGKLPDFQSQCAAMLAAQPRAISSIMGIYPPPFVQEMKKQGIAWFATATTVAEARTAEEAGADVIVAQGMEAGGHRGAFDSANAETHQVGLFALLPAIVDSVRIPVIATGGIADSRGVAAAFLLGASAVQVGTGFLRCPEAQISRVWADELARTMPEDTVLTRAFSGRAGRSILNDYVRAAQAAEAPPSAPYPVQRGLSAAMRREANQKGDIRRMQAWAGQSARLAPSQPATTVVSRLWKETRGLLGWD
jgi:nitronate monooxygenase